MSREERANARLAAVQALYQMDLSGKGIHEIFAEFETHWIGREVEGEQYKPAELEFFRNILEGVLENQLDIDRDVDQTLQDGWPLRRVEAVMRAVLLRTEEAQGRSRPCRHHGICRCGRSLPGPRRSRHDQCGARHAGQEDPHRRVLSRTGTSARQSGPGALITRTAIRAISPA